MQLLTQSFLVMDITRSNNDSISGVANTTAELQKRAVADKPHHRMASVVAHRQPPETEELGNMEDASYDMLMDNLGDILDEAERAAGQPNKHTSTKTVPTSRSKTHVSNERKGHILKPKSSLQSLGERLTYVVKYDLLEGKVQHMYLCSTFYP